MTSVVLYNCRRCRHSVIDWLIKFCNSLPHSSVKARFSSSTDSNFRPRKTLCCEAPTQHNPLDWCPGCWRPRSGSPSWLQASSSTFAMLADVLADLGRPLPAARSAFPFASVRFNKLLSPLIDQPFDGNSFNSFPELHLLCFCKFSIKILSLMFIFLILKSQ